MVKERTGKGLDWKDWYYWESKALFMGWETERNKRAVNGWRDKDNE